MHKDSSFKFYLGGGKVLEFVPDDRGKAKNALDSLKKFLAIVPPSTGLRHLQVNAAQSKDTLKRQHWTRQNTPKFESITKLILWFCPRRLNECNNKSGKFDCFSRNSEYLFATS